MMKLFFDEKDTSLLSSRIKNIEQQRGTKAYGNMTVQMKNDCEHWDCAIKCYCAQSWKD